VELPLFEGYVFCRLEISKRLPILMTPHVLQFVTVGNSPVEIDDAKVAALQAAMRAQVAVEPWPLERDGRPAKLESGPLAGLEGRLVGQEGASRMVVTLPVLCKSVALKIESDWLAPMEANRNAGVAAVHDTD
jgi:transcription antitermination factor NusG